MPSSWSSSLRFELQFTGENINLWGDKLNAVLQHADYAVAGWLTKAITGDASLTTANAGDDEARAAMLKFTGALANDATVTLPSVSKSYFVFNATNKVLTFTTGAGNTASVEAGDKLSLHCDGINVHTLSYSGLALKDYITAFTASAGAVPSPIGNVNKYLFSDGTNVLWQATAGASDVLAGSSTTKIVTPAAQAISAAYLTLIDASSVAWDTNNGFNAVVTLGGNRAFAAPTNVKDGWTYILDIIQDATGSRTPTWNSIFEWGASGPPTLSTAATKRDSLTFVYKSATGKLHFYGFRKAA